MGALIKKIFQNHSTRILFLLFVTLTVLIAYFLIHSYFVQLDIHKRKLLSKLEAISNTASAQIDGNQLAYLFDTYKLKDEIFSNEEVGIYKLLSDELKTIQAINKLNSPLYTLSFDAQTKQFFFGVSSADKPYYRHTYNNYPESLLKNYSTGGVVDVYEDENGHWLSAFSPIFSDNGEVVAVVQSDERFDQFLSEARDEIFKNIGISLIFILLTAFFLIRSMRSILISEDHLNASLIQSKLALEQKNKDTLDSILYAKKIQEAILPLKSKISQSLPESFVLHLPRDIVSGDFYWFKHTRNKIFIASVDCTGHGVPGAFMSMIGSILLDDIVNKKGIDQPDEILNLLHKGVVKALKQSHREKASRDGMDIALCVLEDDFSTMSFAGALRPLIFIRDGIVERIKSCPHPIGGFREDLANYTCSKLELKPGDVFYIFSDGYADQFGGDRNKKFMINRFRNLLLEVSGLDMETQHKTLEREFLDWKGEEEQVDDVLLIGFRI